jgi:membrane complex biogenesis BtpA family protein
MVHVPPLPGSPGNDRDLEAIATWVLRDVQTLVEGGVDGLLLENLGDTPYYPMRVPPHTIAFMTVLARELRQAFPVPLGINVLRNDAFAALAIATAVGAAFIRVNVYTGARLTDQGLVQGEAHELLRYRKLLGSAAKVFADVAVKHSAALAARGLEEEVEETIQRGRADAIIVSGAATGVPPSATEVRAAKRAAGPTPVFLGSGVSLANVEALFPCADGAIVGTAFKEGGLLSSPVSAPDVRAFMVKVKALRSAFGTAGRGGPNG